MQRVKARETGDSPDGIGMLYKNELFIRYRAFFAAAVAHVCGLGSVSIVILGFRYAPPQALC